MRTKTICIFIALYLISVSCDFNPKKDIGTPAQAFQIDFSPDKQFLGIATPSTLNIYRTQIVKQQQTLYYEQFNIKSFAFNKDSSMLVIGSDTGEALLYKYINNNFTEFKKFKYGNQTNIVSMCFTSNSNSIILGFEQSQIVVWQHQTNKTITTDFMNEFVHTVSCSPTEPTLFVAGGSGNTISKFTFYTLQAQSIRVMRDVPTEPDTEIFGSTFSADGQTAYRVGASGLLYKYKISTFQQQTADIFQTNATLTKIRVSENLRLIATAYKGMAVIVTKGDGQMTAQSNVPANLVQSFFTSVDSIALTTRGGHMFFINGQKGYLYGECPFSQYANSQGVCFNCSTQCNICEEAQNRCYDCTNPYYLSQLTCKHCPQGCSACTSAEKCQQCSQGYAKDGELCSSSTNKIVLYFSLGVAAVFACMSVAVCIILVKKKPDPTVYNKV